MEGSLIGWSKNDSDEDIMRCVSDGIYRCIDKGMVSFVIVTSSESIDEYSHRFHDRILSDFASVAKIQKEYISSDKIPKNHIFIVDEDSVDENVRRRTKITGI